MFLPYLDEWEKSVQSIKGVSDADKKRMTISTETLLGIRMTGKYHIVSYNTCQFFDFPLQ